MKAVALQKTKLTKSKVDSATVTDPDLVFEVLEGSEFELRAIAPQITPNEKRLVTFDRGLGAKNYNSWFLFPAHWRINGEPRFDFEESTSMPIHAKEATIRVPKSVDWWDGRDEMISRFFAEADVTNGDNRRIPVRGSDIEKNVLIMAGELDKIRTEWGSPIAVTSWHRPPAVNQEVGGARYSQHLTGGAVDVYTMDGRDYDFEDFLDRHWGGGLGYGVASNRFFTHLDLREGGWRRGAGSIRWTY